jgi:hypothetical protein
VRRRARRPARSGLANASPLEAACLAIGLAGAVLALGVTVAQATLAPTLPSEEALRGAAVSASAQGALCPDGWAADHARLLDLTEAEVTAWYLREAMTVPDEEVVAAVGLWLTSPAQARTAEARAATYAQIMLCVAESRRMTQPAEELVPPELRDA